MSTHPEPKKPCRLVYDLGEFGGERVFDFKTWTEAINFWKMENPPSTLVREIFLFNFTGNTVCVMVPGRKQALWLDCGFKHVVSNERFSPEDYAKAVEDREWNEAYFRKTGKRWSDHTIGGNEKSPDTESRGHPLDRQASLEILGLRPGFSEASLKKAYREKIQMNHPDRVASLDSEFKELAERKSKQINSAYELLKKNLKDRAK